jgi:hypothetical protein
MRLGGACACIAILAAASPVWAADPPPAPKAAEPDKPADPADTKPARPPLPDEAPRKPLPWEQHLEIGTGLAIVAVPGAQDGDRVPTSVRLKPDVGFHVRLSWEVLRYLWFTGYLTESRHPLELPAGSLGVPAVLTGPAAWMFTFGARLNPTFPIGPRVRIWATAGAGWGRIGYPRLCPMQPCSGAFVVHERPAYLVEIPIGIGAAFEIVPRWLRLHVETTGSLIPSQTGEAYEHTQTIDSTGKMHDVGPMPRIDGAITQTIGLSLVL